MSKPTRHFTAHEDAQSLEEHIFEQLDLDLEWAFQGERDRKRQGDDDLADVERRFRAIGGRRWSRFKDATDGGDKKRADEMERFARFWYGLAEKVRMLNEQCRNQPQ